MPRLPRFFAPGLPQHVIQRGNNRAPIFAEGADRPFFKACLAHAARRHGASIHAYVLMTNHVHLVATPADAASLPRTLQCVGRVYVQYFNRTYRRTGTLWEGRYRAAVVDSDDYLLACMRYVELNPVRAGLVAHPGDFAWSSFAANAHGSDDALLTPHPVYARLAAAPVQRCERYRSLFGDALPESTLHAIRDATQHAWALGDADFRARIDALGRRSCRAKPGRRPRPDTQAKEKRV